MTEISNFRCYSNKTHISDKYKDLLFFDCFQYYDIKQNKFVNLPSLSKSDTNLIIIDAGENFIIYCDYRYYYAFSISPIKLLHTFDIENIETNNDIDKYLKNVVFIQNVTFIRKAYGVYNNVKIIVHNIDSFAYLTILEQEEGNLIKKIAVKLWKHEQMFPYLYNEECIYDISTNKLYETAINNDCKIIIKILGNFIIYKNYKELLVKKII